MSLLDRVAHDFAAANAAWLRQLFRQGTVDAITFDATADGWVYHCSSVVLAARLGRAQPPAADGPLCGDNGGRTAKGQPCRLRGKVHGRCPRHPAPCNTIVAEAAATLADVSFCVHGAKENALRPVPATLPWSALAFAIPGAADLRAVDLAEGGGTLALTSAGRVWDTVLLQVKRALGLPPESHVLVGPDRALVPVDPCWLGAELYRAAGVDPQRAVLVIDGVAVRPDCPLRDYGVDSVHRQCPAERRPVQCAILQRR